MRKTIEPILAILFLSGIVVFGVFMLLDPNKYVGDKKITFDSVPNTKLLSYIAIGTSGLAIISNLVLVFIKRSLKRTLIIQLFTLLALGGIAIYAAIILTKANDGNPALTTIQTGTPPQPAGIIPWELYLMIGLAGGGAIFLAIYKAYISGDIKRKYVVQTIDLFPNVATKDEEVIPADETSKIEINVINTTVTHEHAIQEQSTDSTGHTIEAEHTVIEQNSHEITSNDIHNSEKHKESEVILNSEVKVVKDTKDENIVIETGAEKTEKAQNI